MAKFLLLTVGTGSDADLEATLLTPLAKSIAAGEWTCVCLLPSHTTATNARAIEDRHGGRETFVVLPLAKDGDENDPDSCFAHFDQVIRTFLERGIPASDLVADFTRGTKAMSAALVLAAVRHGIPRLRYVTGPRDGRGTVIPGNEIIRETATANATAARTLDLARGLFDHGAFGAVLTLLPDPDASWLKPPRVLSDEIRCARDLAAWYAAWDRLDYAAAYRQRVPDGDTAAALWQRYCPGDELRAWVASLRPDRGDEAERLRRTAVDLLANMERRVALGQLEDALVRAYRIVEMIAQSRLLAAGRNAERLQGREDAIGALKAGGDRLWRTLEDFDRAFPRLKTRLRNKSILIHGFGATALNEPGEWRRLSDGLAVLLREDRQDAPAGVTGLARDLVLARFPTTWNLP
jgi:hypothetical protein